MTTVTMATEGWLVASAVLTYMPKAIMSVFVKKIRTTNTLP